MRKLITLSDEQKEISLKLSGLAVFILDILTFIALISYLLHWREDMSGEVLQNAAGSIGYGYARFLICRCLGLGSFALPVFLTALGLKLIKDQSDIRLFPFFCKSLFGAFAFSLLGSFLGSLLSAEFAFGGGFGGDCGRFLVARLIGALGVVVTGLLVLFLLVIFFILCCPSFARWIGNIGKRKLKAEENAVLSEDPGLQQEPVQQQESVQLQEPVQQQVAEQQQEAVQQPQEPVQGEEAVQGEGDEYPQITVVEGEELSTEVDKPLPRIDNRLDPLYGGLPNFKFYSLDLLDTYESGKNTIGEEELNRNKTKICMTLRSYRIEVASITAVVGPTVTLYKVTPGEGVTIAQIKSRQEDIAMSLNARGVRVLQLSDSVGIEVANDRPNIVPLRGLLNSDEYKEKSKKYELPVAIGVSVTQQVKVFDLTQAPHLLVAGATQQGKSVCLNVIIASLLYGKHPSELKFVFIDPKMVEFTSYAALVKHYLAVLPDADDEESEKNRAIVKNAKDAEKVLRSLCKEMDDRYELMSRSGMNKITLYNDKFKNRKLNPDHGHRFLPYLVVVVDEYADLTLVTGASPEEKAASRSITSCIIRLAQKGRAAGIHVILATQRPSVDVVSGIIKSNFPMRIAFRTSSKQDSMTIIDSPGAEKLIGRGDMLFSAGIESERVQCGLIESVEVSRITEFISSETRYGQSYNTPYYLPEPPSDKNSSGSEVGTTDLDERFEEAAKLVVSSQKASTTSLQTRMGMGFAKAARVMAQLEAAGIVSAQDGSKNRQVLVATLDDLDNILNSL